MVEVSEKSIFILNKVFCGKTVDNKDGYNLNIFHGSFVEGSNYTDINKSDPVYNPTRMLTQDYLKEFDNILRPKTTQEIIQDNLENVGVDTATKVATKVATEQTFGQRLIGAATTGAVSGIEKGAKSFVFDAIAGDEGEGGSYGGYIADFMDPELNSSLIINKFYF